MKPNLNPNFKETLYSLEECRDYFYNLHNHVVNQKYDKQLPYSFHLELVLKQAERFQNVINIPLKWNNVITAIYGHDSIEDARITYNDLVENFGSEIAEVIYLCTEDKGRNRAERKSDTWYHHLKTNPSAVFVKLCDITANTLYSLTSNSSMFKKYKQEYEQKVKPHLYCEEFKSIFEFLDKIYQL